MLHVLLTDAAFTGCIRSLRAAYGDGVRIVGLSTDENTAHRAMVDSFYRVVSHRDPQYIPILTELCRKESIDVILPIITDELESMAESADEIFRASGARVLTPPLSALRIANDKGNLYRALSDSEDHILRSIVPPFQIAHSKQELFQAINDLEKQGLAVCMKRCRGEDAAGFFVIDDLTDYVSCVIDGHLGKRLSHGLLAKYLEPLSDSDTIPPFMVSEYLPGEEWDVDILAHNGRLIGATTRKNLAMFGGLTSVLETADQPLLLDYCKRIVEFLGLSYVSCISFRARLDGSFGLLEINPRMMGNIFASSLSGNHYVKHAIDLLYDKEVTFFPPTAGIRTALYYDQIRIDPAFVHDATKQTDKQE